MMNEIVLDKLKDSVLIELVKETFNLEGVDLGSNIKFLLKDEQIQKLISLTSALIKEEIVQLETVDGILRIEASNILYIEALAGDVILHDRFEETYDLKDPLYVVEEMLDKEDFIRISKSFIVSLKQIRYIKSLLNAKLELTLRSGEKLEVTRSYIKAFKEKLNP